MNKKEIKAAAKAQLQSGASKNSVFQSLRGQDMKDAQLAMVIVSYADPKLCEEHAGKVKILVGLMYVYSAFAFLAGMFAIPDMSPVGKLMLGAFCAAFSLLFAWGFKHHKLAAYTIYIFLTIIQLPKQVIALISHPDPSIVAILLGIAMLAYVWFVRQKLFPEMGFVTPLKVKGQYVFQD